MSFRKLRGVGVPEDKQGLIRYTCLTVLEQPKWVQNKIERLCIERGGLNHCALREVMCGHKTITAIAREYHVAESVLYDLRKQFYESW